MHRKKCLLNSLKLLLSLLQRNREHSQQSSTSPSPSYAFRDDWLPIKPSRSSAPALWEVFRSQNMITAPKQLNGMAVLKKSASLEGLRRCVFLLRKPMKLSIGRLMLHAREKNMQNEFPSQSTGLLLRTLELHLSMLDISYARALHKLNLTYAYCLRNFFTRKRTLRSYQF